ncbi:MAG: hypothetical protein ACOH19_10250 [Rhodoglobus sp.]
MTTLDFAPSSTRSSIGTVQLGNDLWRIVKADGAVIGYVERSETAAGSRYTAKRMLPRQRRFLPIGDFWTVDDALECFRF